jgi:predicted transcriptional regulator
MIRDTLAKIEQRLQKTESINDENKSELLNLLSTLKTEIANLSEIHNEQAESIAGFAELSTRETTRRQKNPELQKLSVEGLAESVRDFEVSHPKLVEIVNAICTTLSNIGV